MRQANQQFSSILTKIGNGERLGEIEISLIESRFYSVEEAATMCPQGIRLFNTNHAVTQYNNQILNSYTENIISTAKDVYSGCTSKEQEIFVHRKIHKMSLIDTNGLPHQTTLVVNIYYMITTNVDVSDGLANSAVGKLVHAETDNNGVVTIAWLEFPELPRIGEKLRRKAAGHAAENNISRMAVPIVCVQRSTIPLNNNKTIVVKRSHIPLVCACATTIHKSQGSTFPKIVYEYEKHHSQSLLYVALSRVTSIEGLYITTPNNDKTFYHGRRTSTSTIDLQAEFKRLSLNNRRGLSLFTFNCQSLRAHIDDLDDSIVKKSNVLVLSEIWLNNESEINITNFRCIAKFKRPNTRAGGVGIYHNSNDVVNIVTSSIDFSVFSPDFHGSLASAVGDLCMAQCQMENWMKILIVSLYISPNQKLDDIFFLIFFTIHCCRTQEEVPLYSVIIMMKYR
ncbi:ATP-dependent DNA helicase [Trichonephila clavipes]|nr:ATP-dependent DNA helicase [Trichonephila clavipes]